MVEIQEREMNKRIQIIGITQTIVEGQPTKTYGEPVTIWAHMYSKIGNEEDRNGRQTGTDRIFWTLRNNASFYDIKGVVKYDGKIYDILSTRELNEWHMQIICALKH